MFIMDLSCLRHAECHRIMVDMRVCIYRLIALFACMAPTAGAQSKPRESGVFIDVGMNAATGPFTGAVNVKRDALLLGAGADIYPLHCADPCTSPYVTDVSLFAGHDWRSGSFALRAMAGPAFYSYTQYSGPIGHETREAAGSGISCAAHAVAEAVLARWFAIGIGAHANLNGSRSVAGLTLSMVFGKRY
jgi:hypothetical protein